VFVRIITDFLSFIIVSTEQLSLMIWPEPPTQWVPQTDFTYFFPQIVAGVSASSCLPAGFGAFEFNGFRNCLWPDPLIQPSPDACITQQNKVTDPSNGGYGADLSVLVTIHCKTCLQLSTLLDLLNLYLNRLCTQTLIAVFLILSSNY
jgi:hypothetical protein